MKKALIFDIYDDYNIRIQYIKSALERNGYETIIYFADFNHVKKEYYQEFRKDIQYIHVKPYTKNLSVSRMYSHALFAKECVKKACEYTDVSLIYVMVPPNSMSKEFVHYKKTHPTVKLWFDVLDMWPESLPVSNIIKRLGAPIFNVWASLRNTGLNYADVITLECNLFYSVLKKYADIDKFQTIYLCQPNQILDTYDSIEDEIHFLYCGSINNIIDIDCIVDFLKGVMSSKKVFVDIIGEGEHRVEFIDRLKQCSIPYQYHGIIYDESKKQEIYKRTHFGLNIMKDTVFVGLTMKSLEYLSHGIPIINNIKGDTTDIVNDEQIGFNVSNHLINDLITLKDVKYQQIRNYTKQAFLKYFDESIINQQLDTIIKKLED